MYNIQQHRLTVASAITFKNIHAHCNSNVYKSYIMFNTRTRRFSIYDTKLKSNLTFWVKLKAVKNIFKNYIGDNMRLCNCLLSQRQRKVIFINTWLGQTILIACFFLLFNRPSFIPQFKIPLLLFFNCKSQNYLTVFLLI